MLVGDLAEDDFRKDHGVLLLCLSIPLFCGCGYRRGCLRGGNFRAAPAVAVEYRRRGVVFYSAVLALDFLAGGGKHRCRFCHHADRQGH